MTIRNDATRDRIRMRETRKLRSVVSRQGQVLLDTDIEGLSRLALDRVETADADVMGAPGRLAVPAAAPGFAVTAVSLPGGKLDCTIGTGRGYLDGWLLENTASFTLSATGGADAQPHPWACPAVAAPAIVGVKSLVRLIDPVEDVALADRALGDAQSSGRSIVDWQVFVLPVAGPIPLTCADVAAVPAWQDLVRPSSGKLQFIKAEPAPATDPCSLSEAGGYTRLENLLYRVEVHRGTLGAGAPDVAIDGPRYELAGMQLKLSRCNASVMVRIDQIDGKVFKVSPAALDPLHWFAAGQLAELVSIHDDVDAAAGHATERLFRVASVTDEEVELVDRSATDTVAAVGATADGSWFLRMWECLPDGGEVATVALDGTGSHSTKIDLGDGIAIQLEGDAQARFRRGDYWTCAMRADGEIEWTDGQYELPAGPEHRYAPLATVNAGPGTEDCRILLASLADRALLYRGGDGQEAMPDPTQPTQRVPLASPLRTAVMRGEHPVAGAKVIFEIKGLPAGKTAQLSWQPTTGPAVTGTSVTATTDAQGLAEVAWEIDPTEPEQWVHAILELPVGSAPMTPLVFTANLSEASEVGFDPKAIPIFAGITDVQRALEALAGMQQAGCATYVLTPDNWREVIKNLKKGESAKLCFQRGTFKTDERVVFEGLGALTLCGAGDATLITVQTGECAMLFAGCASVHLSDVAMTANDGATPGNRGPHVTGRGGTLTVLDCPEVEILDASFACGGQAVTERTCVTVRGTGDKPLRRVRIAHNRITTGFAQDGILVTEAEFCVIEDNVLTAAELPKDFDRVRVLQSKAFQPSLLRALVPDHILGAVAAATAAPALSADGRLLRAGAFSATFDSPIPQAVWNDLVTKTPPVADDQASAEAFGKYVDKIFQSANANQDIVTKFAPDVVRLEQLSRTPFTRALRAAMLRSGEVKVSDRPVAVPAQPAPATRNTVVTAAPVSAFPKFNSVLSESGWQSLLARVPVTTVATTAAETADQLRKAARMALADAKLRGKVAGLGKWFDDKFASISAYARQAITIGGKSVGDASVCGNRVSGFAQAVHVGASFHSPDRVPASFRSVTVAGNFASLYTMGDTAFATAGIFVGNADTIRIADNLLTSLDPKQYINIKEGIRVWGKLGRFLAIEKNRVGVGRYAIRIKTIKDIDKDLVNGLMWLVADNLGDIHSASNLLKVPWFVERRYNRPA